MAELNDGGDFDDLEATADEGIKEVWWNTKWLPIASNGLGDLICFDLAPAKGGNKGQVITFRHDQGRRERLAWSLGEWLAATADEIQAM